MDSFLPTERPNQKKVQIRVHPRALQAFRRRVRVTPYKPSQVLRSLLRALAEGSRLPNRDYLNEEALWERSRPGQVADSKRSSILWVRLSPDLVKSVRLRTGTYSLAAMARALMREYAAGQRDVSNFALDRERIQERTRRKEATGSGRGRASHGKRVDVTRNRPESH
jgi:hypothetical protein